MLGALYRTKKALREAVGQPLRFEETSMFGPEYREDGTLTVVGPSPYDRRWFARVTMQAGRIARVQ